MWVSVMQVMVSGKKLVPRPMTKEALCGLVHLQVDLIPNEVMQAHNRHKGQGTLP
jgi:hypothetical protein